MFQEFKKTQEKLQKLNLNFGKGLTEKGKINVRKSTSRVLGKISNNIKKKTTKRKENLKT